MLASKQKVRRTRLSWAVALAIGALALAGHARAEDPVFIEQLSKSTTGSPDVSIGETPGNGPMGVSLLTQGIAGNSAVSITTGVANKTAQVQAGSGHQSVVRIHNGLLNQVGIVQGGENLSAKVGLVNTVGVKVGVFQQQGSEPVNTWVIGLKNGGLLIKP